MPNRYSARFPLKPAPEACLGLTMLQIQVQGAKRSIEFDPNSLAAAVLGDANPFGSPNPHTPSELSGEPGYLYPKARCESLVLQVEVKQRL